MNELDALHIYFPLSEPDGGKTVRQKLTELAKANHRSLSAEARMLIEAAHAELVSRKPIKRDLKG